MQKERNTYLDILKAISIIFVIVGHCIQYGSGMDFLLYGGAFYNPVYIFIYSFHMPLLMIISGYLFAYSFKNKTCKDLLLSKCKQILIPLLAWSFISLLVQIIKIACGLLTQKITFLWLWGSIVSGFFGGPWFLWAIWWCGLVIILGRKFLKDNIFAYILLFIVSFVIPDNVVPAVYKFMWPFFLSGYIVNKYNFKEKFKKVYLNKLFVIACFITFIVLLKFYNFNTFIYTSGFYIFEQYTLMHIDNNILRFLIGFFGSASIMYVIYALLKITPNIIKKSFSYIGKCTMGIYIISNYLFDEVLKILPISGLNYWYILVESISVFAVSFLITFIIQRFKITNYLFFGGR